MFQNQDGNILLKKSLLTIIFLSANFFFNGRIQAQTITLLSPTGAGGFESGTTFTANGWTEVQAAGDARKWWVGTPAGSQAGTRAAYVGSSTNNNGIANAKVDHFYRDLIVPAGAVNVQLNFYLKQITTDNTFDYFYVFTTTTANTPVTGTIPGSGYVQRFVNTATAYPAFTAIPTIDLSSLAGTTVRLVFTFKSDAFTPNANPAVDNISFTYENALPCSGTPSPGNTLASAINPVCSGSSVTLSLQNPSSNTGLNYQWESSADGTSWSIIPLALSSTYVATPVASTYYQCKVTCTNSNQFAYSGAYQVQTTNCINMQNGSITTCSAKFYDSGGPSGSYVNGEDYTYTFYPLPGNKIQIVFNSFVTESGYDFLSVFDGNSVSAPQLFSGSGSALPGTFTSSAADGSLTIHFTSDLSLSYSGWDATVSCISIPACTGTPVPGNVTGNTAVCYGSNTTLTATGATIGFSGLQYQWEESDDNGIGDPWAIVTGGSGATTINYTSPVLTNSVYYRMTVTCTNSGQTVSSPGQFILVNPLPVTSITPSSNRICGIETVTLTGNGAASYSWSPATGLNATTGAVVIAGPASTTTYTVTGTTNGCSMTASTTIDVYPAIGSVSATADTTQGCDPLSTTLHANACLNVSPTMNFDSSSANYTPTGATGFLTMSSADDGFATINLPFSFNYFGNSYTSGFVSTNGFLAFGTSSTSLTAQQLPNATTPNNIIALCWNDLLHSAVNTGVDTFTVGSVGSRKFVIRFNAGAVAFYNIGSQSGSFGGKIILHEGTNKIELRIDAMNMGTVTGRLKTLGVENSDGTIGFAAPGKNATDWLAGSSITYGFTPGFTCSGSGSISYVWLPSSNLSNAASANPDLNALSTSTVYTVTATATSGCTASATLSMVVQPKPAPPVISAGGPLAFCPGGNVVLTSSSPVSNHWSTGETTASINVNTSRYITLYTTNGSCSSQLASTSVTRYDTIQPLITVLGGGLSLCSGTRELVADGLPQFSSWNWSTTETTQSITISSAATYSLVATDLNNCITHNEISFIAGASPVSPVINANTSLVVCNNEYVTMTSDLSDNILWLPTYDNSASISYNLSPPGTYDFYVIRDSMGCTSESNHLVFTVNPVPEVYSFLPVDSACPGDVITLNGSGLLNVTSISFNGTPASVFTIVDDYSIQVTVPYGATSGSLNLMDNLTGCSGQSPVFTIKTSCLTSTSLQLKLFLQGYYLQSGSMNPALYNSGLSISPTDCDTIHVCLMDALTHAVVECSEGILDVNGLLTCYFSPALKDEDFYIRIQHRNSIETWSSSFVEMESVTNYDFSINAAQAYGSNQVEVSPGIWALWSGDITNGVSSGIQDGQINTDDFNSLENDTQNLLAGYHAGDLNGDGIVESADYALMENNQQFLIVSMHP
ncbi:MAG: hypothetical protein IPJ66_14615 [Bacteroidetes bacterium]|nr:hypothetical protein [Bacteroidota bacterium]